MDGVARILLALTSFGGNSLRARKGKKREMVERKKEWGKKERKVAELLGERGGEDGGTVLGFGEEEGSFDVPYSNCFDVCITMYFFFIEIVTFIKRLIST